MYIQHKALKQIPIFSSLKKDALQKIASVTTKRSYKKNDVIFHQDDSGNGLFILISGIAKISLIDSHGKELLLKVIRKNDFFGEMSLLDGYFRSASVMAMEDSHALLIMRQDFIRLIQQHPQVVLDMLVTFSRRIRKTDKRIQSLAFFDATAKLAEVLLDMIDQYGKKTIDGDMLDTAFSRQNIADMAGISRETCSRVLHTFQENGILLIQGKCMIIFDKIRLERELL